MYYMSFYLDVALKSILFNHFVGQGDIQILYIT